MIKSKLRLFLLIPLASLVLLSARCRHCEPTAPVTLPFPEALKPYVDFGVGSYWIYEDSATGRLDSVVLINKVWGWDEASGLNKCKELEIGKRVESLQITYNVYQNGVFQWSYKIQTSNGNKLQTSINDSFTELDDENSFYILSFPLIRKTFFHVSSYNITQDFVDTLAIDGKTFRNLLHVHSSNSSGVKNFIYDEYYKDKIGKVLELELDTFHNKSRRRELVNYKII